MVTKAKDTKDTKDTVAPEAAAKAAAEALDSMMAAGKETAEAALKAGSEAATDAFETAAAIGESQLKRSTEGYKAAATFGKDNIASMNAVAGAVTAGMEAYGETVARFAKTVANENLELMGRFMSAKTPEEVAALQMEAVTRSVDRAVSQTVELNRIVAETWMQSAAPVRQRMDAAMQAASKTFTA